MELDDRVELLEHETTILKNEIQAILLDLRESYLARENPFAPAPPVPLNLEQTPQDITTDDDSDDSDEESPCDAADDCEVSVTDAGEVNPEEVTKMPLSEMKANHKPDRTRKGFGEIAGLSLIAALLHWVSEATGQLGQEGSRAVVDVAELMGNVSPGIKDILFKLISFRSAEHTAEITTQAYLASLVKLTESLGKCDKDEAALISILLERKADG